jgi:multiple sugar transport system substrate-binding protein
MNQKPKKMNRRKFIYAGLGAVIVIVGGIAAYFAAKPPEVIKETVVQTIRETVSTTVEKPIEKVITTTIEKPVEKTVVTTVAGTPTTIVKTEVKTEVIEKTVVTTPTTPVFKPIDYAKDLAKRVKGEDWKITGADFDKIVNSVTKDLYKEKLKNNPSPWQWIPPDGYKEVKNHVSEISFINAGALKDDPATEINVALFEYYTGVKMTGVETGSGMLHPKQVTIATARSPTPEILYVDRMYYWEFAKARWIEPIDEMWEGVVDLYHPTFKGLELDGHYYGSPGPCKTTMCFYRKDIFEKYGIGEPPKTWQELIDIGKQLTLDTDGDGRIDIWGWIQPFPSDEPRILYENIWQWIYAQGGTVKDAEGLPSFETDYAKNAIKFMHALVNKYKITPPGITTMSDKPTLDAFLHNKAAMMGGWDWFYPRIVKILGEEKIGTFVYPKSAGWEGTPEGTGGGLWDADLWCVNSFAKPWAKEAAKLFLDLYKSYMGQYHELCIENNGNMTIKEFTTDPRVLKFPIVKKVSENIKNLVLEIVPNAATVAELTKVYLANTILGKLSPEEASKKAQAEVDKLFGRK